MDIFDRGERTDGSSARPNEPRFAFLNRAGSDFFVPVRDLLQRWLDKMPVEHHPDLVGKLRSNEDGQFESAFWELYLYQLLTATGAEVSIHPDVPGTAKHPDFLVHADAPFYLEAVTVQTAPIQVAESRRLADVQAVLESTRAQGWTLDLRWESVGPRPFRAARLRERLHQWVLDLERRADGAPGLGSRDTQQGPLPVLRVDEDG